MDNVNHPKHYEKNTSLECIDAMKFAVGTEGVIYFCLCNAFKYLWRCDFKNGAEDIEKARWYVDYGLNLLPNFEDCNDFYCKIGDQFINLDKLIKEKEKSINLPKKNKNVLKNAFYSHTHNKCEQCDFGSFCQYHYANGTCCHVLNAQYMRDLMVQRKVRSGVDPDYFF